MKGVITMTFPTFATMRHVMNVAFAKEYRDSKLPMPIIPRNRLKHHMLLVKCGYSVANQMLELLPAQCIICNERQGSSSLGHAFNIVCPNPGIAFRLHNSRFSVNAGTPLKFKLDLQIPTCKQCGVSDPPPPPPSVANNKNVCAVCATYPEPELPLLPKCTYELDNERKCMTCKLADMKHQPHEKSCCPTYANIKKYHHRSLHNYYLYNICLPHKNDEHSRDDEESRKLALSTELPTPNKLTPEPLDIKQLPKDEHAAVRIGCWNARGLGNKSGILAKLISEHKLTFLGVQECKGAIITKPLIPYSTHSTYDLPSPVDMLNEEGKCSEVVSESHSETNTHDKEPSSCEHDLDSESNDEERIENDTSMTPHELRNIVHEGLYGMQCEKYSSLLPEINCTVIHLSHIRVHVFNIYSHYDRPAAITKLRELLMEEEEVVHCIITGDFNHHHPDLFERDLDQDKQWQGKQNQLERAGVQEAG